MVNIFFYCVDYGASVTITLPLIGRRVKPLAPRLSGGEDLQIIDSKTLLIHFVQITSTSSESVIQSHVSPKCNNRAM